MVLPSRYLQLSDTPFDEDDSLSTFEDDDEWESDAENHDRDLEESLEVKLDGAAPDLGSQHPLQSVTGSFKRRKDLNALTMKFFSHFVTFIIVRRPKRRSAPPSRTRSRSSKRFSSSPKSKRRSVIAASKADRRRSRVLQQRSSVASTKSKSSDAAQEDVLVFGGGSTMFNLW